jgi:glycosidase
VNFLRSHDELDLGRLTEAQRQKVFQAFAPDKSMQLYNRGIRRRLAPMLDNHRERLELAFSLMFTLPGTPMLQYGDEIMRYQYEGRALITLHNFSAKPRAPRLEPAVAGDRVLVDLLARNDSRADAHGRHTIQLPAYGYRWYRPGGIDRTS